MSDIRLTDRFRSAFPGGIFGALAAQGCPNRPRPRALAEEQRAVESRLRARVGAAPVDTDLIAGAYALYFRRHGGRYPVAHQAKTVLAGRSIESSSALVEVMFTAELDSLVLTSGHDLRSLVWPLSVDVAGEGEVYTKISGKEQALRSGDMVVRDGGGVIASVFHGPDFRTRVQPETDAAFFGAWCPAGIPAPAVAAHLGGLARLLSLEWPEATVGAPRVLTAGGSPWAQ
jgi:DNA/RNA-binding domain of Phe-tRNA-synthetase-like protein